MAELTERAVLRNLQKEQERERRRLRDRQRRQSMSVEEREKHLARRRRNYQLRRLRARNVRLDPQVNQASLIDGGEMLMISSNENHQATIPAPVQCNGTALADSNQSCETSNAGNAISVGLEVPAQKLAKLPRRSRLNHIKHLARSLFDTLDIGDSHKIAVDMIAGNTASNCTTPKVLRLNRVKHLARALSSDTPMSTVQNHKNETEAGQNLPTGEHLTSSNLPKVANTNNSSEDE